MINAARSVYFYNNILEYTLKCHTQNIKETLKNALVYVEVPYLEHTGNIKQNALVKEDEL